MLGLMFLGFHVATTMLVVGLLGALMHFGMPAINAVGEQLWAAGEDYLLLSIPLYILLGEILMRGGATDKMYQSLGRLAQPPARRPAAHQHRRVGAVLGGVGLVGGDRGDHLHRRAAGLQEPQATTSAWCSARSPPAPAWAT